MEAMHLGIKEFIPLPMAEQKFAAALEPRRPAVRHGQARQGDPRDPDPRRLRLDDRRLQRRRVARQDRRAKTVLIDLDTVRGGVSSYFDVRPRYTLADVMDSGDKVDKQLLDNALTMHHTSGLAILSRPELPEDTQRVTPSGTHRLLGLLGRVFDYVVIDSVMSIDPVYQTAISGADVNLFVMQLNVPKSAKNAERMVGCLRRMGIESTKIRIVVNRYVKKGATSSPRRSSARWA